MSALAPGQMLEGTSYRVVRQLGEGGMGVVYEVEHVRLGKPYVAKVLHERIRGDASAQQRIEREAKVLAELGQHPNVVQVHDVGTTSAGLTYFVMDRLEGMDLRAWLQRGAVDRLRAPAIVADVLDALAWVHQRGLVHRDIKPENVFLAQTALGPVTKVLDFGVVHVFDADGHRSRARITKTGGFVGTLFYAAPEQMKGDAPEPANDVYAAALVLYELLAGRGPFDDDPGVGLSRCFKPAPRLGGVSERLAALVASALDIEPGRRPRAADFAAALRSMGPADVGPQLEMGPPHPGTRSVTGPALVGAASARAGEARRGSGAAVAVAVVGVVMLVGVGALGARAYVGRARGVSAASASGSAVSMPVVPAAPEPPGTGTGTGAPEPDVGVGGEDAGIAMKASRPVGARSAAPAVPSGRRAKIDAGYVPLLE